MAGRKRADGYNCGVCNQRDLRLGGLHSFHPHWTAGLCGVDDRPPHLWRGVRGGFNAPLFRAFYLLGGVLGVIWLSMGTLFLLAPRRVARTVTLVLAAVTIALAVDAAVVQVDTARLASTAGVLGDAISNGSPLQLGAIILNILGTLILVGGSAWSAYRLLRDHGGAD